MPGPVYEELDDHTSIHATVQHVCHCMHVAGKADLCVLACLVELRCTCTLLILLVYIVEKLPQICFTVCLYVCTCVCITCTHMYMYMYISLCTYTCTLVGVLHNTCTYMYMYMYVFEIGILIDIIHVSYTGVCLHKQCT